MARGISFIITGSAGPLRKAIKEASDSLAGMSKSATIAFGAAAAATTLFAKQAVQSAADDQKQQAILAQTLRNTTGATTQQIAAVEGLISAMQTQVAFTDTELRAAYQSLAVGTGSLTTAQNLLTLTLDVSVATQRDAASVADALAKGYQGNMKALAQLSPELKTAIKNGADFNEVVKILGDNFGGAATTEAGTFAGQMQILSNQIDEAKEAIGNALIPVIETFLPKLKDMAVFVGQNAGLISGLATVVGLFAGAIIAAKVAMALWDSIAVITTAVNWALATSYTAVQVATGIGIVTALAGAAAFAYVTSEMNKQRQSTDQYASSLDNLAGQFGKMSALGYGFATTLMVIDEIEKATEERRKKAAEAEAKRWKAFVDRVNKAKKALREYVAEIQNSIASSVNLGNAFQQAETQQADAAASLNAALEERKNAYETLDQARQSRDMRAYSDALDKVAAAEAAVTEAKNKKPQTYGEIFRQQVEAAKEFSGNLKKLIAAGLGKAGLAQILNLGPVAGNAVAKDLLAGTGGMTAASLEKDLASVMAEAGTVGLAFPGVAAALTATPTKTANTYSITVQAGVADKTEVAKQVVEVLQQYEKRFGAIPVKVKG